VNIAHLTGGACDPCVRTFFDQVCPFLFDHRAAFCEEAGGRYAFELAGAGAWTLDFARRAVEEGARDAQLIVRMRAADFARLLQGELNLTAALADGRFAFEGERDRFEVLAAFTRPIA
jgi:hypothetical protein